MARRIVDRRELRAQAEAAEKLGIGSSEKSKRARSAEPARSTPDVAVRMRVVWGVCDVGGRTVATFPYPEKAAAEELAAALKKKGKGLHFVRSIKEPIDRPRGDD